MEKASGGSFAPTSRKTAEDEGDDEDDWDITLNTYRERTREHTEFKISQLWVLFSGRVIKFAISGPKDLAMARGSGRPGSPKILSCLDATTAEDRLLEVLRV